MDDFLHNLRSGKLRRIDKSGRNYSDQQYKGPQTRGDHDNRRNGMNPAIMTEQAAAHLNEALTEVKLVLENIAANQKRLADACEREAQAHERKAVVMERIADLLIEKWPLITGGGAAGRQDRCRSGLDPETFEPSDSPQEPTPEHEQLIRDIEKMRDQGMSFTQIAEQLEEQGVATISGKGQWRGQTVSKLLRQGS